MDGLWVCDKLLKVAREREEQVIAILANNELQDMAQYRTLMGEITALGIIQQEISEMLEKGTTDDDFGTVVTKISGRTK
jgi:CheY-like chemotaxis protein